MPSEIPHLYDSPRSSMWKTANRMSYTCGWNIYEFASKILLTETKAHLRFFLTFTHPQCLFLCWWYSSCLGDVKARSHTLHVTSSSSKVNHNGVKNILNMNLCILLVFKVFSWYICSIFIPLNVRKSQNQIILFSLLSKSA